MEWNLKDFGDSIEKNAYKILSDSACKSYTKYWGSFIGNRNGNSIPIKGISEEHNNLRLLLGQWCYIVLRNQVFIHIVNNITNGMRIPKPTNLGLGQSGLSLSNVPTPPSGSRQD